jgi:hypothetical protein
MQRWQPRAPRRVQPPWVFPRSPRGRLPRTRRLPRPRTSSAMRSRRRPTPGRTNRKSIRAQIPAQHQTATARIPIARAATPAATMAHRIRSRHRPLPVTRAQAKLPARQCPSPAISLRPPASRLPLPQFPLLLRPLLRLPLLQRRPHCPDRQLPRRWKARER